MELKFSQREMLRFKDRRGFLSYLENNGIILERHWLEKKDIKTGDKIICQDEYERSETT